MKITKSYLKTIIKEELHKLNEATPVGSYATGAMSNLAKLLKEYHDLYNLIYNSYSQRRDTTRGSKLVAQQTGISEEIINNIFRMKQVANLISSLYRSSPDLEKRSDVNTMQFAFADKMLGLTTPLINLLKQEQNLKNGKIVKQENLDSFMNQTHEVFMQIFELAKQYKQKSFLAALGERG